MFLDHSGLEHIPSTDSPSATSLPYTLACVRMCSERNCPPALLISFKRSSTGTFAFGILDAVVQPLDSEF